MAIPEINIKQLLTEVLQYPNSLKFPLGLLAVNLWDSTAVSVNGFDIMMWMKVTTKSKCSRILINFLTCLIFLSVLPYRLKSGIRNILWKCLSREFFCSFFFNLISRRNLWSTSRLIFRLISPSPPPKRQVNKGKTMVCFLIEIDAFLVWEFSITEIVCHVGKCWFMENLRSENDSVLGSQVFPFLEPQLGTSVVTTGQLIFNLGPQSEEHGLQLCRNLESACMTYFQQLNFIRVWTNCIQYSPKITINTSSYACKFIIYRRGLCLLLK